MRAVYLAETRAIAATGQLIRRDGRHWTADDFLNTPEAIKRREEQARRDQETKRIQMADRIASAKIKKGEIPAGIPRSWIEAAERQKKRTA